jgi:imidazolonepropionase-like amidohydrolase
MTDTVIHAGTLLDEPGQPAKHAQSIRIKDDKITAVADGYVDPPAGARLIDLKDRFVLPGLIDCHVHLTLQFGAGHRMSLVEDSDPKVGLDGAHRARLTLEAGFTTVRDVGAQKPEVIFALRSAIAEGKVPGPRVLCVGCILSPTGGHGQVYGFRRDVCECVQSALGVCDGPDECRKAVRRQVAMGADAIKIVATGGVLSNIAAGIDQQFTNDEINTLVETAHHLGRRISAHAHGTAGVNAALRAGIDSIEHGSFMDDESIDLFLKNGAFHTPTVIAGMTALEMAKTGGILSPAQAEKAFTVGERIKTALAKSYKAGVKISFGTDMGVGPHGENAREFGYMVECGMTPADAIKAATVTAAELLNLSDQVGTIAAGKSADIIATAGDPLSDVGELQRMAFVMARGAVAKMQ